MTIGQGAQLTCATTGLVVAFRLVNGKKLHELEQLGAVLSLLILVGPQLTRVAKSI
ncbi:MAG: hypothetical protein ACR2MY_11245 [Candidatus Dormibacteria bacterium]